MADLKKPLDQSALDALTLSTEEARAAYQEQRQSLEIGRPIRQENFTPEQEERIRANIRARGMTFEVFLPEQPADWLRELLAAGVFKDAGEAAFIAFQEMQELDRNPEIRKELLNAIMKASADDPRPGISTEKVEERQRAKLREYANSEPPSK